MAIPVRRLLPTFVTGLALLFVLPGCGYNKLQGLDEEVKGAWAEVQNQYQRRADLVPNLVNTVKGEGRTPSSGNRRRSQKRSPLVAHER